MTAKARRYKRLKGIMAEQKARLVGAFGHLSYRLALQVLHDCGGHHEFLESDGFSDTRLAEALGYTKDEMGSGYQRAKALRKLGSLWRKADKEQHKATPSYAAQNLLALAEALELDTLESKLLTIAVASHIDRLVHQAVQTLGSMTNAALISCLAILVEATEKEVAEALFRNSRLWRCGLLRLDGSVYTLEMKLDLPPGLLQGLDHPVNDPLCLLGGAVRRVQPIGLSIGDYSHLEFVSDYLVPILQQGNEFKPGSRNILLWGPSGCGKTSLCLALVQFCGLELYEVAYESDGGEPHTGEMRLRIAQLAQHIFRQNPRAAILVDEAEDIFGQAGSWGNAVGAARKNKGYLHKLLDESTTPTFWLTNSVEYVDPASIRRFVTFELPSPSKECRLKMFRKIAGVDLVDDKVLQALAGRPEVAPGVVASMSSVIGSVQGWDFKQRGEAMRCFVHNTIKAQNGGREVQLAEEEGVDACYDLAYINADGPVEAIQQRIARLGVGRVLLTGHPGCGKSAFARYVAQSSDMSLKCVRMSDILGPFVGQSEANLSELFRSAHRDKAILMIDEIDSLLFARSTREQAYVTRLTNEMLTQLERFQGVFFGSTNMVSEMVDPAGLRRFDFKINFDWLKPGQSRSLLKAHCKNLGLVAPTEANLAAVAALPCLAPGDFSAVARQAPVAPIADASDLVRRLEVEVRYKPQGQLRRGFGFLAEATG